MILKDDRKVYSRNIPVGCAEARSWQSKRFVEIVSEELLAESIINIHSDKYK